MVRNKAGKESSGGGGAGFHRVGMDALFNGWPGSRGGDRGREQVTYCTPAGVKAFQEEGAASTKPQGAWGAARIPGGWGRGLTGGEISSEVGERIRGHIIWVLWAMTGLWSYSKCDGNSLEKVPLFDLPSENVRSLLGYNTL